LSDEKVNNITLGPVALCTAKLTPIALASVAISIVLATMDLIRCIRALAFLIRPQPTTIVVGPRASRVKAKRSRAEHVRAEDSDLLVEESWRRGSHARLRSRVSTAIRETFGRATPR